MLTRIFVGAAAVGMSLIVAPRHGYAQQPTDIGKQEYVISCAVCHGDKGKGDGPLVEWLKKPPADLTKIQKNNVGVFPFDRIYEVIDGREAVAAHGPRDMPVWGDTYSTQAAGLMGVFVTTKDLESFTRGRIIALIGYIYTLQAK
ncbi:MAG TPA: cytochrome c [Terriglobales bacterium]|nr:cytochrome c [Terriglobales bacterium]